MLRGDGENTSDAERREKEKKRRRELASKADSRIAYAYALTHVNVYANAPHGATRRPTECSSTEKKKNRKDGAKLRTGGKRLTSEKTLEEVEAKEQGCRYLGF